MNNHELKHVPNMTKSHCFDFNQVNREMLSLNVLIFRIGGQTYCQMKFM